MVETLVAKGTPVAQAELPFSNAPGTEPQATSPPPHGPEAPTRQTAQRQTAQRQTARRQAEQRQAEQRQAEQRQAEREQPAQTQPAQEPPAEEREVLSVARLDRMLKRLVEGATTNVLVRGEVSGLSRAGSGHLYFSLKDEKEDALIDCVMYRSAPAKARRVLNNGECAVLTGRVTIYPPRGRMQFVADDVLGTARGALLEALEKLKAKLAAEGLFDEKHKKPLPSDPRRIAVLTSRAGAAIHDVVRVAFRRGRVKILLVPTPVQGMGAAERIADAIRIADGLNLDALIVTRGGGSVEDLAAYNDELVVRAIARAGTPVVSAVGHEIDISLSDLVADARAATPSQAAEMLVPDGRERQQQLDQSKLRLVRAVKHHLTGRAEHLTRMRALLGEPRRMVLEQAQRFDELSARLERVTRRRIAERRAALVLQQQKLAAQHPRRVLAAARARLVPLQATLSATAQAQLREARVPIDRLTVRLSTAMGGALANERQQLSRLSPSLAHAMTNATQRARQRLAAVSAQLDALSPLAVLHRGYAIACDERGRAVLSAGTLKPGDTLTVRLHEGTAITKVEQTEP